MKRSNEPSTGFGGMPARAFTLLRSLEENNESGWMREHRPSVIQDLRAPFIDYLEETTRRLREEGFDLRGGEETVFRMQRDLRFTADRRPFHEHVEAVFSKGGARIGTRASIHVRLDRSGGFLRAGSFLQPAASLAALRESMMAREARFLEMASGLEAAGCPLVAERSLKRLPRGFEEAADRPIAAYLRQVDPVAERPMRVEEWRDGSVIEETLNFAQAVRPWLLFIEEALV
ncbi:hypothetical protein Poly30_45860 [Planctomycetes bacterium Poly30]|uniref:DUF2461 domain-containing protein n=1 Tax=Saltatorellus ferox TaxID=2528018 RepID=A0A518EY65_9BACT|nr:hypothetical protein Poly30_45860 [Planctomycetes bacterium Poly30]